jgi:hypothetical protein
LFIVTLFLGPMRLMLSVFSCMWGVCIDALYFGFLNPKSCKNGDNGLKFDFEYLRRLKNLTKERENQQTHWPP